MSNARITLKSLSARMDSADEVAAQNAAGIAQILALLQDGSAATTTEVVTAPPAEPKAQKAYRSAKGKEQAKADVAALWTKTLADAGVKRAKDLTPKQMDAYRAQSKAIWAAVPKTRSTKA